jgi:hypothetical protein
MYGATKAILTVPSISQSITLLDGSAVDYNAGDLIFCIKTTNIDTNEEVFLDCVTVSFSASIFTYTKSILNAGFGLLLSPDVNSLVFSASQDLMYCNFIIDASAMGELPSCPIIDNGGSSDNGGGTSSGGFSVPSLNGNCGSLFDGTSVSVAGLDGDFKVVGSQFLWNDKTDKQHTIVYRLSNGNAFCLVPDAYVTAKAS